MQKLPEITNNQKPGRFCKFKKTRLDGNLWVVKEDMSGAKRSHGCHKFIFYATFNVERFFCRRCPLIWPSFTFEATTR